MLDTNMAYFIIYLLNSTLQCALIRMFYRLSSGVGSRVPGGRPGAQPLKIPPKNAAIRAFTYLQRYIVCMCSTCHTLHRAPAMEDLMTWGRGRAGVPLVSHLRHKTPQSARTKHPFLFIQPIYSCILLSINLFGVDRVCCKRCLT